MEQDRAWRKEWRAMSDAQRDRAMMELIATFERMTK
jgi:hypothetical protein